MNEDMILEIEDEEAIVKFLRLPYPAVSCSHPVHKNSTFYLNALAAKAMKDAPRFRISVGYVSGEKYIIFRPSENERDYIPSANNSGMGRSVSAVRTLSKLGMTCTDFAFQGRKATLIKGGGIAVPVYEKGETA